jgi:predicted nucleic acid-binding protein
MKTIFVDTFFYVDAMSRNADLRLQAEKAVAAIGQAQFVTTDLVLTELLNYYASYQPFIRKTAASLAKNLLTNAKTEVIQLSHQAFLAGLTLYESRLDKGYSLTDCISMNVMRERGITEVLTHDNHFAQEGFVVLI